MNIRRWIDEVTDLVYPRQCIICEARLCSQEKHICTACLVKLPYTQYHLSPADNDMERLFRGCSPVKGAVAMFSYHRGSRYTHILAHLKYYNLPEIGVYLGKMYASMIASKGFFDDVDMLLPVPLSPQRLKKRGYNQAERIAHGISLHTRIPVKENILNRQRDNTSQTRHNRWQRLHNTEDLFYCPHPEVLESKHVLLIDDVVTTGATLLACCHALEHIPGLEISILSLGHAKQ